jgi:hypothetical protein
MAGSSTRYGRDVRRHLPDASEVPGLVSLRPEDDDVWSRASPHLRVRNNDTHSLYAYAIAQALLRRLPEADRAIVLPAILLHDTGWSTVRDEEILEAIAPGGGRPDLVRRHEIEGARIAREVLQELGRPESVVTRVTAIIDGHDSRPEALSIEDAIVKDADKIWRVTPHGLTVVSGWFDLEREEALRLCASRVESSLHTDAGRAIAAGLIAVASMDLAPQRQGLA